MRKDFSPHRFKLKSNEINFISNKMLYLLAHSLYIHRGPMQID